MAATDDNKADYLKLNINIELTYQAFLICYVSMHGVLIGFTHATARSDVECSRYTLPLSTLVLKESSSNLCRIGTAFVTGRLLLYGILSLSLLLLAVRCWWTGLLWPGCTLALLIMLYAPFSPTFQFNAHKQTPIAFKSNVICGVVYNMWWI